VSESGIKIEELERVKFTERKEWNQSSFIEKIERNDNRVKMAMCEICETSASKDEE
jgi:hypothetical protein